MRVWNEIPPENLCRNHLLAEHRETLCIWSVITNNKKGYSNHPEVLRWKGHLPALQSRHQCLQEEAQIRGYNFKYPEPWDNQIEKLQAKNCECVI